MEPASELHVIEAWRVSCVKGSRETDIKGLELSEEEQNLRIKLEDEVFKNKKGFVDVNVSAIFGCRADQRSVAA